MEKSIVILGKEVSLNKKGVLNFISQELGKNESFSMVSGEIFFVKDVFLCEEKELMLNVVQSLEKETCYKLSDCGVLKDDLNWILEGNLALKVGHVLEFFFREHINNFQKANNPLFQKTQFKKEGV